MNFKMFGAAASAALSIAFIAAPTQAATVYDAVTDFSATSNVLGDTWTYGYSTAETAFTLFSRNTECFAGLSCWQAPADLTVAEVPTIISTLGANVHYATVTQPGDLLNLHPGQPLLEDTILRFTAPTAGTYHLNGFFQILDSSPSGVEVTSPHNLPILLTKAGQQTSFNTTLALAKNSTIDFRVNNFGNFSNDSTGLSATLTAVPEPASWALMILGFGGVGASLRSRRRVAAAV